MFRLRLLAAFGLFLQAACYPCTYSLGGDNYDATPLANSATDYSFTVGDMTFFLNICQPTVTPTCGSGCACCQIWTGGQASLGAANTAQFTPPAIPGVNGKGFTIQFTGGTVPPGFTAGRSMELDMICDPTAGVGTPNYDGEEPQLHYNFQWRSKYACPVSTPPPPPPPPPACTGYSCTTCLENGINNGCYWCLDSGTCGLISNFNSSACKDWISTAKYCPVNKCASISTCDTCTITDGCSWCIDSASCITSPTSPLECASSISNQTFCPSSKKAVAHG